MISTQIQALFLEAFENSVAFRHSIRCDILAVMERDPAVKTAPDVSLYCKGFQALQAHRVSHWLWKSGRPTLALFLHSRANTVFQIDIHPGAQLGDGVFIDHGTGVVIGETAVVGDNVSMLHKVTLGGSGNKDVQRHPIVGNGVLLGAGATLLGNIRIGDGAHIGACSMVLEDIPAYIVAVGYFYLSFILVCMSTTCSLIYMVYTCRRARPHRVPTQARGQGGEPGLHDGDGAAGHRQQEDLLLRHIRQPTADTRRCQATRIAWD